MRSCQPIIVHTTNPAAKQGFLLLFFYTLIFSTYAQGPQRLVTVPVGPGTTISAWLYLPADYTTSTKNYPVLFFYHGQGEAGTNPNLMLAQGIPQLIANGMRPDNIINPADGQPYSFIVLSAQHWSWSPDPEWLPTEIAWLKQNYRIDTNRIYVTGLSAGGQQSFKAVVSNPAISGLLAASAPLSPVAPSGMDYSMIKTYRIKTWFFSGNTDPITPTVQGFSAQCNTAYPASSRMTIYGGNHCCWNTLYNTNWKDSTGISIWQWFLTNKRYIPPLPISFTDFKVTDLGNKKIRVDFSSINGEGNEKFYIQVKIRDQVLKIAITPQDKTGSNTYSKTIDLN